MKKLIRVFLSVLVLLSSASQSFGDGAVPQRATFSTADNGTVDALIYGEGSDAVVLAHGAVFNKESWEKLALPLAAKGLKVVTIDFRGYGKSKAGTIPGALHEDIIAAIRYLHRNGARRVSVIGASMGGGAAGEAAVQVETGEIAKLILLAPAPIKHPERIKAESLFVWSRGEPMAGRVQAQFEAAPAPKRSLVLEGGAHAQHIFKTDQGERLKRVIVDFLI